jgi:hypothetical protein
MKEVQTSERHSQSVSFVLVGLVITGFLIFQLRIRQEPLPLSGVAEASVRQHWSRLLNNSVWSYHRQPACLNLIEETI